MKSENLIAPELRYRIRMIVNKAGISCGKCRDITLMNRFYRSKDRLKKEREKWHKQVWIIMPNDSDERPWTALDRQLKEIEEVEHLLFEDEFLTSEGN